MTNKRDGGQPQTTVVKQETVVVKQQTAYVDDDHDCKHKHKKHPGKGWAKGHNKHC